MAWGDLFGRIGQETGVDPGVLSTYVRIESGGDPNNQTGSYKGLFQLSDAEFKKHGDPGANIFDPVANARAGARKYKADAERLASRLGRAPAPHEVYLAHQQGEGGAAAHWANPTAPAWVNMASTAEGRAKGPGWAKAAIWGNVPDDVKARYGSVDNITSGDFVKLWEDKYARLSGRPDQPSDVTTPKIAAALTGQQPMTAAPMISAVYDPNEMTPEAVALQRKIAMGLLGQGSDISPVGHPLAALARAIQGGIGGYQVGQANEAEKAGLARESAFIQSLAAPQMARAASPTSAPAAPPMVPAAVPSSPMTSPVAPTSTAAPASATGAGPNAPAPSTPGTAPPLPAPMGPNGQRLPLPSEMRPPVSAPEAPSRSPRMTEEQYQAWRASIISQPGYLRMAPEKRKVVDELIAQRAPVAPKISTVEGDVVDLSDPNNPKVLYRAKKPTNEQSNYESYALQERSQGRQPMSELDYAIKLKQAGVAQPENAFETATAKAQAARMEKIVEAGDTARGFRGQMDLLREHSRNIGNAGAMADIKQRLGPLATSLGVPLDKLDDIQAFNSIIEKVAPTMRAPGSGATSDIEYKGFLKSLPQASATAQGREMIINQLSAIARDNELRAEIASRVQNNEIGRKQADEALRRLPDVMSFYREYQKTQPQQPAVGAKPVRVNSPEEAAALPPGTPFISHDGREMVKR